MKIFTPTGREITEDQANEEGRIVCSCRRAVIEDEWLAELKVCIYCWEQRGDIEPDNNIEDYL